MYLIPPRIEQKYSSEILKIVITVLSQRVPSDKFNSLTETERIHILNEIGQQVSYEIEYGKGKSNIVKQWFLSVGSMLNREVGTNISERDAVEISEKFSFYYYLNAPDWIKAIYLAIKEWLN